MALVTTAQRVADFVARGRNKSIELTMLLKDDFDYQGYQSYQLEDLMLKVTELNDFIGVLLVDDYGGIPDKVIHDTIDFFNLWLELHKTIAGNFTGYTMPIQSPVSIISGGPYALNADLQGEISARILADQAIDARLDALEAGIGDGVFPDGFFDNYATSYSVIFDDDTRLHSHSNKAILDAINSTDLTNIKALVNHFLSVGAPGGLHVNQADRDSWGGGGGGGSSTAIKYQYFTTVDALTDTFIVTNGTLNQILFVTCNGVVQTQGVDYGQAGNSIVFTADLPNATKVGIVYAEGLSVGGGGDAGVYDLTSPTNITVGGLPSGSNISGRTWQSIVEELLVDYLLPQFLSFGSVDIPAIIEVGTALSGSKAFTWNISNPVNVQANTVKIRDVTAGTDLATGLANDGAETVAIGTIANTAPINRAWQAQALNTNAGVLTSASKTLASIYPYFSGKVASGGAAPGASRPAANQSLINSGAKVVALSTGDLSINFASTADDYIWFATPAGSATKLSWYVDALNNGPIGGAVSPGGNLFPDPVTVSISSPTALWATISFKIYISNYQTTAATMQLRNSA